MNHTRPLLGTLDEVPTATNKEPQDTRTRRRPPTGDVDVMAMILMGLRVA